MRLRRVFILCHPESIVHARPGDLVVTDVFDVCEAAAERGITFLDLRAVISGSEDYLDRTVITWRSFIDRLESPKASGVPVLGCLRGELIWEVLVPFARYAAATTVLAPSSEEIATDTHPGGTRRGAIEAVLGVGAVVELPRIPVAEAKTREFKKDPALPPSHGEVAFDPVPLSSRSRGKALALATLGRSVSSVRTARRPSVIYGHYRTMGGIAIELGKRFDLILWPWALPRAKDVLILAAGGAVDIAVPPSDVAFGRCFPEVANSPSRYEALEEAVSKAIPPGSFFIFELDVTDAIVRQIAKTAAKYSTSLATRLAAATDAVAGIGADCIVIPNDSSLDFAALARVGASYGLPIVVVAHGLEGSKVPGDKRLASVVFAWSERMAEDFERHLQDTGARIWVSGPPHLEQLERTKQPRRDSVLFLSYAVRHNTAWESWMDAERYLDLIARAIASLGNRLRVVGLKIHPSEDPAYYRSAMKRVGLNVPLLYRGWVHENLEDAGVVVGPISTGLAEAYRLGSLPLCVNLSGGTLPPPCDGSTEIPIISESDSLEHLLSEWLDGRVWPKWTPADWPAFGEFIGSPEGADRRVAELVGKVIV
jgi:hypothetical protein